MRALPVLLLPLVLTGCLRTGGGEDSGRDAATDADGDGFNAVIDCDDTDAERYPGNDEVCDDKDNDCDGEVDEDSAVDATAWYADADSDGYGDAEGSPTTSCEQPTGTVDNALDCDDSEHNARPDGVERCGDGLDNDCDGEVDEDEAQDAATFYVDADGDGYGSPTATTEACARPEGYAANPDDCDDADDEVFLGADELCGDAVDNDCDGYIDEEDAVDASTWYADADGDGYGDDREDLSACSAPSGYVDNDEDCDDTEASTSPAGEEVCDSEDNDCDGQTDEDLYQTLYRDKDGDGYGNPSSTTWTCLSAEELSGYVEDATDCDDTDADLNPETVWYADADGDGYGDPDNSTASCSQPTGYLADDSDCDDSDESINPDSVWYADDDGDGYGDPDSSITDCVQPTGYVTDTTDCDDTDDSINPDTVWYADADGDGYGDPDSTTASCEQPTGYLADDSDCDDTDADLSPETEWYEDADGDGYGTADSVAYACEQPTGYLDNTEDCDDTDDSLSPETVWYRDLDSDGYGDPDSTTTSCEQPTAYVEDDSDCDDTDYDINPELVWYADTDGDGYGTAGSTTQSCEQPSGYVDNTEDCDDDDEDLSPETVWYRDYDKDGYGDPDTTTTQCTQPSGYLADSSDCDDADNSLSPETVWYLDADGDGFGVDSSAIQCEQPSGYVDNTEDCDDDEEDVNPDATEVCDNGVDDDCDGLPAAGCRLSGEVTDPESEADVVIEGSYRFDQLTSDQVGAYYTVSMLADVDFDQDGITDLAFLSDDNGTGGDHSVHIVFGAEGATGHVVASGTLGEWSTGSSTTSVAGGDFDGDGIPDLAWGDDDASSYDGAIYLHQGPLSSGGSTSVGGTWSGYDGERLGRSIASGDIDGDGLDDLVAHTTNDLSGGHHGGIYLLMGTTSMAGGTAFSDFDAAFITGNDSHTDLGLATCFFDNDGDAYEDFATIDWDNNHIRIFSGSSGFYSGGREFDEDDQTGDFNIASGFTALDPCANAGDMNGDGYEDLAFTDGQSASTSDPHTVYLALGPISGEKSSSDTHASITDTDPDNTFGDDLAGGGDMDGDGLGELIISGGYYNAQSTYNSAGRAYLFYGSLTGALDIDDADWIATGYQGDGEFGYRVAAGGSDFDGDGDLEVVISSTEWDGTGSGACTSQTNGCSTVGGIFLFEHPGL